MSDRLDDDLMEDLWTLKAPRRPAMRSRTIRTRSRTHMPRTRMRSTTRKRLRTRMPSRTPETTLSTHPRDSTRWKTLSLMHSSWKTPTSSGASFGASSRRSRPLSAK